ncbi:hypothetical protein [Oceanobacillus chungangensis]|uniref:DUF4362 domain-containing protein n=1 Tax=Oceanobacillus chungangensis TaxID=1229152 RepID=A0A3D8PG93_9BACI|nr:hypothetical protein [Oceanobacillus chungangensis]RDW15106.1 hypothetical protein CWR45_18220 [Oceanobacillus chungangensis]
MKFPFIKKVVLYCLSLILLSLFLYGCNSTEIDSLEDVDNGQKQENPQSTNVENDSPEEKSQEEIYIPNESDVVFKNNALSNKDILDNFVEVAGENNESQIRVVKYQTKGVIIYDLESEYDSNANVGWIMVKPDLSYYKPTENEVQDVIFNNASQQCAYMSIDEEEGFYKLNECRTHWEYRLLPIVNDTFSNEEIEDLDQTNE